METAEKMCRVRDASFAWISSDFLDARSVDQTRVRVSVGSVDCSLMAMRVAMIVVVMAILLL